MSNLQLALIVLAVVVIAGVYGFNRWQERRYRQRAESAFKQRHEDVLMSDASPPPAPALRVRERIEPQFQGLQSKLAQESEKSEARATQNQVNLKEQVAAELRADRRSRSRAQSDAHPATKEESPETSVRTQDIARPRVGDAQEKIEPRQVNNVAPLASPPGADHLDYQIDLVSLTPIAHSNLEKALKQLSDLANRVYLWGAFEDHWTPVDLHAAAKYNRVRATIQLVTRSGMLQKEDLITFKRAFERCANEIEASLEGAEIERSLEVAQDLEKFCLESDVVLGLSVVAQKSGPFAGTKIRAWAEAAGFQLRPNGVFLLNDEHGAITISMESHDNPGFLPERIRSLTTNGVTMILDVPRVSNGLHAFDRLVGLARHLANTMGGALVDDNRAAVSESGLDQIRTQLKKVYERMDARGIPAGGPVALRLFQ